MAARRANGEGTIYRRSDGRFEGAIFLRTASGKSKRTRVYAKTRQEVHQKLIELKAKAHQGIPIPDKNWKLGEYLDSWLEHVVRKRRPTTYERYEAIVRLHLKPELAKYSLAGLSVQVLQRVLDLAHANGASTSTLHNMRKVLSAALTHAQRNELLFRNVARLVELTSYRRRKIQPWTADEVNRFLEVSRPDPLYPAFVLLALYGIRRGEVLGLRWCDVDFERNILHIRQQLQRVGGSLHQSDLKTEAGRRDEPLLKAAAEVLREQRVKQLTTRAAAGEMWQGPGNDLELVFTTRTGQPIEPRNFNRSFARICKQHGIRRITVHGIRHTNITLQKNAGVPDRDIQEIAGHSDVRTTQNVYEHVDMSNKRDALEKVERLFWRGADSTDCRQLLPSAHEMVDRITSFLSGSRGETRTRDPRLMRSIGASLQDRATEVNAVMEDRRKQWLVGVAAVTTAVSVDYRTATPGATIRTGEAA